MQEARWGLRNEMLMKLVAKKKKKERKRKKRERERKKRSKVCRRFFSGSMTGFYGFFPPPHTHVGLYLLFQLKTDHREKKGKNTWTSMHLILLKTLKNCRELKNGLWTDSKSKSVNWQFVQDVTLQEKKTVYVISKCRKMFVFSFFCNWFSLPPGLEKLSSLNLCRVQVWRKHFDT